ncbi:anti-FecI sigma factor FecR [Odoribacter splanchnicus CAG:14]|nr:FecR family protein [Odoribacter splanchnicus]CDB09188.1 anti-FecI sigma factor FecR [Odoribacter splanchnicus CAG:14]
MLKKEQDKIKETLSISDKISDILSKELDVGSQHVLDSWLAQNEQNKALFNKICSDNTIREKIYNYKNSDAEQAFNDFLKARKQRSNRRIYYRFLSGAAVIAICFGFWALIRIQEQETQNLQVTETEQQLSDMPANKPVLTLGDGTRMNVWGDNLYFKETEKGQKIMLGDSLLSQKEDSITADSYNTLEVPLRCDFNFTMSDGTRVWINAASTLKYPAKFAADSRTVYASGEIYLEVAKDAGRPFYVVVDGITVKVLGTSFNIRAYADENDTKVTLLEGKIAAQINDKEYTLTPGKQLKRDKTFGETSVRTVDPAEIVSWTRGYYIFKKARLQEVVNTLKNWYGVNIMLSSGASDIIYTGVVNKEEKLEVFLRRLEEVSNVKCSCNGKFVTIY